MEYNGNAYGFQLFSDKKRTVSGNSGFFTRSNKKTRLLFTRRLTRDMNPLLLQTVGGTGVNFSLILKILTVLYHQPKWP